MALSTLRGMPLAAGLLLAALSFGTASAAVAVTEQTLADSKPEVYDYTLKYPTTGVAAIDAVIAPFAEGMMAEFKSYLAERPEDAFQGYSAELTYQVTRNDDEMFVVVFGEFTYFGGAHPNSASYAFNFTMPDAEHVTLAEIVGQNGLKRVSELAIADLKSQWGAEPMSDDDWLANGAGPMDMNYASFQWLKDELVVVFDSYQVAAYAAGPQEVHIPHATIAEFIRADWTVPVASFDCAKAGTAVEKAICGDRALARLDRQASDAYALKLRYAADDAAREKAKADQRAWLKTRDDQCGGEGDEVASCLTPVYQARIEVLQRHE